MGQRDADGRAIIRGFGPNPRSRLNVSKDGYAPSIGHVTSPMTERTYGMIAPRSRFAGRSRPKELTVILQRAGWIEGAGDRC